LEDVQLEEEADMGGFEKDIRKVGRKVCVCVSESCQKIGIYFSGSKFSACVFITTVSLLLIGYLVGWLVGWLVGCLVEYTVDTMKAIVHRFLAN
jgi:hypothetical protein